MLTVGSLFSGIGGLEYGLELTEGFKTIWQCEIDPYASAVLRKHYPDIPNLGDITKVDWATIERPDLICGGFPCQDISVAGKGAGIKEGTRSGLWSEFAKAIRALRPRYALIENVPMLANRGLNIVLADLAETGYDAEWHNISAASVGAWHKRERIFIIAYPRRKRIYDTESKRCYDGANGKDVRQTDEREYPSSMPSAIPTKADVPVSLRGGCNGGKCDREERHLSPNQERDVEAASEGKQGKRQPATGKVGDVPDTERSRYDGGGSQEPMRKEDAPETERRDSEIGNNQNVPNTDTGRLERTETQGRQRQGYDAVCNSREFDEIPNPNSPRLQRSKDAGNPEGGRTDTEQLVARQRGKTRAEIWAAEPGVGRVVDGLSSRVDRIKCLGNAVVPQVAEVVGKMILEMERSNSCGSLKPGCLRATKASNLPAGKLSEED